MALRISEVVVAEFIDREGVLLLDERAMAALLSLCQAWIQSARHLPSLMGKGVMNKSKISRENDWL